jgi:formiminotetrahydrofolate cyclodeaminase
MSLDEPLSTWVAALASSAPTPGGGGASALTGALAAALAEMVGQLTAGRAKFRDVEPAVRGILAQLAERRDELLRLVEADAEAYAAVSAAYALPRATDDERQARDAAIQQALALAIEPPKATAAAAASVLALASQLADVGNPTVASDAGCAAILAEAAVRCAGLNVLANAVLMRDQALATSARHTQEEREREATKLARTTLERVRARMGA